jgi:transcription elongation factor GreA
MDMADISYFTKEGLQRLKDEVRQLETVERPKISQHATKVI